MKRPLKASVLLTYQALAPQTQSVTLATIMALPQSLNEIACEKRAYRRLRFVTAPKSPCGSIRL
jgi:hypothetical protein